MTTPAPDLSKSSLVAAAAMLAAQQHGNAGAGKPGGLVEAARRLAAQQLAAAGRSEPFATTSQRAED